MCSSTNNTIIKPSHKDAGTCIFSSMLQDAIDNCNMCKYFHIFWCAISEDDENTDLFFCFRRHLIYLRECISNLKLAFYFKHFLSDSSTHHFSDLLSPLLLLLSPCSRTYDETHTLTTYRTEARIPNARELA